MLKYNLSEYGGLRKAVLRGKWIALNACNRKEDGKSETIKNSTIADCIDKNNWSSV